MVKNTFDYLSQEDSKRRYQHLEEEPDELYGFTITNEDTSEQAFEKNSSEMLSKLAEEKEMEFWKVFLNKGEAPKN